MKLQIPKDVFSGNYKPPEVYLCTQSGKVLGELQAYDISGTFKFNSYSEIQLSIDREYTDVLTGKTVVNPLFDKAEAPRQILLKNIGRFTLQDLDTSYSDKNSKTLTAFSFEYASAGSKYLENFKINTGEDDSVEVIYWANQYGNDYGFSDDDLYKKASGVFDASENYYYRSYKNNRSYQYEQIQIANKDEYAKYDGSTVEKTLYVKKYPAVRLYWPDKPELSLLHLVLKKLPEWHIGSVPFSLRRKERKFDVDRQSVYDFLTSDVADTFKAVIEWDTLTNTINVYEEENDGLTENDTINANWETDVYISRDNLANEVSVKYSTDNIKTRLKVSGSDDLDIREVNLGKNYIMNLDYYHNLDWMEQDLYEAYRDYIDAVDEYSPKYTEAMQGWVAAYNQWNDLMNAVPAEGNIILVGDEFKKLYCIYSLYNIVKEFNKDTQYYIMNEDGSMSIADPQPTAENFGDGIYYAKGDEDSIKTELIKQLTLYHVNDDIDGKERDNVLLTLKNSASDVATLRIKNSGTKENPNYEIQVIIIRATVGTPERPITRSIESWINGNLRTSNTGQDGLSVLKDFKVTSIGIMGAYFVLAKDERKKENLQDYGVKLLQEKHDVYTMIFQTQTEAMFSQEKYQCIVSDTEPEGNYDNGTRWLDTNETHVKGILKEYKDGTWVVISRDVGNDDAKNYENYQRYIDNFDKLKTVQEVLIEKEKEAGYSLNGHAVPFTAQGHPLIINAGETSQSKFELAALTHFGVEEVSRVNFDPELSMYIFLPPRLKTATIYREKPNGYKQGDIWITGHDAPDFIPKIYTLAEYYIIEETFYIKDGSGHYIVADVQPQNQQDIEDGQYYTILHYSLEAKKANNTYSDADWGETTTFAVYLRGTTPYVAYEKSQGVYQTKMNWISKKTELEGFLSEDQWIRLSPLIREDEFSDTNFLLTGYESEEERLKIGEELMQAADKQLKTLSQPSLEFSMNMANILALPEFEPITNQFSLGNFIRIELIPGLVKRSRLLEVQLNFSDLSDFSATFGNLVTTKSEIDLHAELLSQAVQAGRQVAKSADTWQKSSDKVNSIEQSIADGLANATLEVGRASGQNIQWGEHGIWGRKLIDGTTDQYEDEQFRIINNKLLFSGDGFKTTKAMFGKYTINGEERWGPLAEYVTAGYIEGSVIKGGTLEIGGSGGTFKVNEDGSFEFLSSDGNPAYASKSDVDILQDARKFHTELEYSGSTVFSEPGKSTTITCHVYSWDTKLTDPSDWKLPVGAKFSWIRSSNKDDTQWNNEHINQSSNVLTVTNDDIEGNAQFSVEVQFDDENL